jgi:hypothetical protein
MLEKRAVPPREPLSFSIEIGARDWTGKNETEAMSSQLHAG